ncbi:MAG TPA: hypothetical protein VHB72_02335 [Candidatus Saccharimonadales bacterium]|nr:hypothetical protein [Candidatus Saccharimonadales bacterium]
MFEFGESVDPDAAYVEERQLGIARAFVEEDEVLGVLAEASQDEATDKIARMMTALDAELFLQEPGKARIKTVEFLANGHDKAIVLLGTKTVGRVTYEGVVLDVEVAREILSGYDEL